MTAQAILQKMTSSVLTTGQEKNYGQDQEGLKQILNLVAQENNGDITMSDEARMARTSLKKTVAYATELLTMIGKSDELEAWIQAKISDMDHSIESVYGYYKFGEYEESDDSEDDMPEEESEAMGMGEDEGRVIINMDDFPRP